MGFMGFMGFMYGLWGLWGLCMVYGVYVWFSSALCIYEMECKAFLQRRGR